MRIALIKSSSMGDVIHALPVVSDLIAARPGIEIDWLVEESFADLPPLHPGVGQTLTVAVRRWRRTPFAAPVRAEVRGLARRLRERRYDLALDLQGLIKSAWLARLTGAPVAGFDWASAREPLATLAYRHRYAVKRDLHAIERLRQLAGLALGYPVSGLPRFGLRPAALELPWCPAGPYAVLVHATSRADKQWPVERWVALASRLMAEGVSLVLPSGSEAERQQAQAIAAQVARGPGPASLVVAPRMSLAQCAAVLSRAGMVVGVDTGLTHLAAALSRPTVALFAATPGWRFGPYWSPCAASLGELGVWPQPDEVHAALARLCAAR
ncbi:MAG TPA: lipopolysaccharide heptosyltransferase I [Burkholderiaceae bacterium]|nr:lipopolysaccharide heptosyltransferase I [Burkholderiaceae bacterium]